MSVGAHWDDVLMGTLSHWIQKSHLIRWLFVIYFSGVLLVFRKSLKPENQWLVWSDRIFSVRVISVF